MKKSVKNKNFNQQIVDQLELMKSENEKFETNELSRSNKTLYSLLGKVYEVFNSVDKKDLETPKRLKSILKQRGVKVQENTPFLTVLIRYVFNSDRSKSFNYNRVISSAIQKKISPKDLSTYIEKMGGVEECKKEFIPSQKTIEKQQTLRDSVESFQREFSGLGVLEIINNTEKIKKIEGCQFVFTVGRLCDDGKTIEVVHVLNEMNKSMEKTALKMISKQLK